MASLESPKYPEIAHYLAPASLPVAIGSSRSGSALHVPPPAPARSVVVRMDARGSRGAQGGGAPCAIVDSPR